MEIGPGIPWSRSSSTSYRCASRRWSEWSCPLHGWTRRREHRNSSSPKRSGSSSPRRPRRGIRRLARSRCPALRACQRHRVSGLSSVQGSGEESISDSPGDVIDPGCVRCRNLSHCRTKPRGHSGIALLRWVHHPLKGEVSTSSTNTVGRGRPARMVWLMR